MSSSGAMNNMTGGLRGINKKVTSLQKDIETNKLTIDEIKVILDDIKSEFGKVYDKVGGIRDRCEEVENNRQGMEISFIKALRRSGKDKKGSNKVEKISTVSGEELKKINSQLIEKSKKLAVVETNMKNSMLELELFKSTFKEKINEIVGTLHLFENFRKDQTKGSSDLKCEITRIQENLKNFNNHIENEVEVIKGPMTDLISDQQREREILEENLKRQQVQFREMYDEYSLSMKTLLPESFPLQSRITTARPQTRKTSESPRVSVKHKFFESNNIHRVQHPTLKAEDNWLAGFPDGKTVALPKVGIKKIGKQGSEDDYNKSL